MDLAVLGWTRQSNIGLFQHELWPEGSLNRLVLSPCCEPGCTYQRFSSGDCGSGPLGHAAWLVAAEVTHWCWWFFIQSVWLQKLGNKERSMTKLMSGYVMTVSFHKNVKWNTHDIKILAPVWEWIFDLTQMELFSDCHKPMKIHNPRFC